MTDPRHGGEGGQWERIKEVFGAALERRPSDRAAFLDHACAGDTDVRREVDSLLAAHEASDTFLETPASALAASPSPKAGQVHAGQTIGTYRVLRTVGRGGMATVYLAHDLRHRRQVALKVMHPELAAALGPDRFLREIDVSAQPEPPAHPSALRFGRGRGASLLRDAVRGGRIAARPAPP